MEKDNPFIAEAKLYYQPISIYENKVLADPQSGEVAPYIVKKGERVQCRDKDGFWKMYRRAGKVYPSLKPMALKLFMYVAECLEKDKDTVFLSVRDIKEKFKVKSSSVVRKALKELMICKVIDETEDKNLWFVNINILFNGDKVKFLDKVNRGK